MPLLTVARPRSLNNTVSLSRVTGIPTLFFFLSRKFLSTLCCLQFVASFYLPLNPMSLKALDSQALSFFGIGFKTGMIARLQQQPGVGVPTRNIFISPRPDSRITCHSCCGHCRAENWQESFRHKSPSRLWRPADGLRYRDTSTNAR